MKGLSCGYPQQHGQGWTGSIVAPRYAQARFISSMQQQHPNTECLQRCRSLHHCCCMGILALRLSCNWLVSKWGLLRMKEICTLQSSPVGAHSDVWACFQAAEKDREDITSNAYVQMLPKVQAEMALLNEARGSGCFDVVFYREHNPDVKAATPEDVWQHFLRHGQFEMRTHRYVLGVLSVP
jgi:hypothetical protein